MGYSAKYYVECRYVMLTEINKLIPISIFVLSVVKLNVVMLRVVLVSVYSGNLLFGQMSSRRRRFFVVKSVVGALTRLDSTTKEKRAKKCDHPGNTN
jgi:hypothetical protein